MKMIRAGLKKIHFPTSGQERVDTGNLALARAFVESVSFARNSATPSATMFESDMHEGS